MNRLKELLRLLTVIPLLIVLVGINFYEDPSNIFHDASKEIASAILDGKEAYFGSGNGNERKVKQYLIEGMPKDIECVTIGPSLSLGIRRSNVGTDSYYNLSASSLNFNDIMAEFAMLELNNVNYNRVILCVDSYFFDETYADVYREPELKPYTEYMLGKLDSRNTDFLAKDDTTNTLRTQVEQLFSVSYFQASIAMIRSNDSIRLQEKRWGIIDESTQNLAHYTVDGSWVYDSDYRNNTVDNVIEDANVYDIKEQFAYDRHLSEYYKEYFRKLVKYLLNNNVQVDLFLCPLCPALWDRLQNDSSHYFILDEIEAYANEVANEFGIRIIGSYNPYVVGIADEDYWDSRHIRHDVLDIFFDFKV